MIVYHTSYTVVKFPDLYFSGDIDKKSALKKLRYEEPNHQICISSQRLIDEKLKFIKSELI